VPDPLEHQSLQAEFSLERNPGDPIQTPPFHLLVLSGLSAEGERPALTKRKPVEIDRDNFDEVLRSFAPRVSVALPDSSRIELEFQELDDFHPDRLFERVEVFSKLRDLRARLKDDATFFKAARDARDAFPDAERANESASDRRETPMTADVSTLLESIIESPAGGGTRTRGADDELGSLVDKLVRPHLVAIDEGERGSYLNAIDLATSSVMRSILHDRDFQKLESAWRGLFFLVRKAETSSDLKIFAADLTADEIADNLKEANTLADSEFYRLVIGETIENASGTPWAAIAANFELTPSVENFAFLMRVSKIISVANLPFITHVRPEIIGVHSLAETPDRKKWDMSDVSEAGKLWSALRSQSESEFLGVVMPRVLGRVPYGAETDPIDSFAFEEFEGAPDHDRLLWSNGCFVAAALLAMSFSESEWSMGRRLLQNIDGLPTFVYSSEKGSAFQPCTEALLSDPALDQLIGHGLMPLAGNKNSDECRLAMFQSISGTRLRGPWN
jgi:type VI secretion system protein ImpC